MRGRRAKAGACRQARLRRAGEEPLPCARLRRTGSTKLILARLDYGCGSRRRGDRDDPWCSASMISRHTGAAPLVPETARIESPSRLPTHTATVKRSEKPMHQLSRIAFDVPVLAAAQKGSRSAESTPNVPRARARDPPACPPRSTPKPGSIEGARGGGFPCRIAPGAAAGATSGRQVGERAKGVRLLEQRHLRRAEREREAVITAVLGLRPRIAQIPQPVPERILHPDQHQRAHRRHVEAEPARALRRTDTGPLKPRLS
jgi:hypothetical protein